MNSTNKFRRCVKLNLLFICLFFLTINFSCSKKEAKTVSKVFDKTITRLYATKSQEELKNLTYQQAISLFSKEDLEVLATRHWMFDVNVPVVVSVIRSVKQKTVPFWLETSGFKKTGMTMNNEMTTYEVWQKSFPAGTVGLGINGLENYSLHYFVSVAPQNINEKLELSNFYPENQFVGTFENGAFTYHDWTELALENVPDELKGQKLLTTIRGRGTETHLVSGFRTTKFPSSAMPDQVLLTWSSDPSTSVDIQWRTDTTINAGVVFYREKGSGTILTANAQKYRMEDLLLMNDRFANRFTAKIRELNPGTKYEYRIEPQTNWMVNQSFSTSTDNDEFSFIWFGDTHYSSEWGKIANTAFENHPDAAFFSIAGDVVSDGLHRDQWDELWEYSKNLTRQRPLMCVPGNHDNRLGLGAKMYRDMFSYPENGPKGEELNPEQTYSFTYKNALFLMIDATSPVEEQTSWIEKQLKNSDATWKFAMFHFPPYNWEEPYVDIQQAWVPLFDKYHVDIVFGGHIHYYMRSKPMKAGKVVDSYNEGTAYIISIGIPSKTLNFTDESYADVRKMEGQFYQYIKIEGDKISYFSVDSEGNLNDSFIIYK